MRSRPVRRAVANALAVLAVLGIVFGAGACTSEQPPAPAGPARPGVPATGRGATDDPLAAAGQGAAALAALGGLGQAQGADQNVRDLGGRLATDGRALLDRLRAGAGSTFDAEPTAEQQAALADLRARTGAQFDLAWLRTAGRVQQQAREAANAVLADASASAEARTAAREALTRLDSLAEGIRQAGEPAGVEAPRAVDAGGGGQAAGDVTPAAVVLVGFGAVLLGGALWWRRRIG